MASASPEGKARYGLLKVHFIAFAVSRLFSGRQRGFAPHLSHGWKSRKRGEDVVSGDRMERAFRAAVKAHACYRNET